MTRKSSTLEWIVVGGAGLVLVGLVGAIAAMLWPDGTTDDPQSSAPTSLSEATETPTPDSPITDTAPTPVQAEPATQAAPAPPTPQPRTEAPTAPGDRAAQVGEAVVLNDQVRWLVIEFRHEDQQVVLTVETENLTDQTASLVLPVFEDWSGQQFDPDNTEASCTPGAEVRPGEVRQCSWSYQVDADSERMILLVKNYADPFGAEQFVRLGWQ